MYKTTSIRVFYKHEVQRTCIIVILNKKIGYVSRILQIKERKCSNIFRPDRSCMRIWYRCGRYRWRWHSLPLESGMSRQVPWRCSGRGPRSWTSPSGKAPVDSWQTRVRLLIWHYIQLSIFSTHLTIICKYHKLGIKKYMYRYIMTNSALTRNDVHQKVPLSGLSSSNSGQNSSLDGQYIVDLYNSKFRMNTSSINNWVIKQIVPEFIFSNMITWINYTFDEISMFIVSIHVSILSYSLEKPQCRKYNLMRTVNNGYFEIRYVLIVFYK